PAASRRWGEMAREDDLFPKNQGDEVERGEFARILMRYLKSRSEEREMAYHPDTFTLSLGDDIVALLPRYHEFLNASPENHDAVMDSIYQSTRPPATLGVQAALANVMPVLRTRYERSNRALAL